MTLYISPPFGSYIRDSRARSIVGSLTPLPRPGRGWKITQFVLDNLLHPVPGGWRNRIGLRNKGICSIDEFTDAVVYSLVGLEQYDWEVMLQILDERAHRPHPERPVHVELNLGCQNVHDYSIEPATLAEYASAYTVTAKLPAGLRGLDYLDMCEKAKVHSLHVANTLPDLIGSISGRPLKPINLTAVEMIAARSTLPITGGGGIYEYQDLLDYHNAGATSFSLGTVWFRPWKAWEIVSEYARDERFSW